MKYQLESKRNQIDQFKHQMKSPEERIKGLIEKRENLEMRLLRNIEQIQSRKSYQFEILKTALSALNPLALMDKGFAVISKDNHVITSISQIEIDQKISIRLKDGKLDAKIINKEGE